jgi:dienelactone hydrolase
MLLSHRQKQHRRRTNCPRANIKSSDHTVIKFRSIRSSRHNQINEDEQDYDGDELDSSDSYSDDDTNDISELLDSLPSSTKADMDKLTVPQLKQQLRLRNLKVSGKKQELLERLLVYEFQEEISTKKQNQSIRPTRKTADQLSSSPTSATAKDDDNVEVLMAAEQARQQLVTERRQKAEKIAEEYGQEFIDVTAYLDDEDKGKDVKSSIPTTVADDDDDDDGDEINTPSKDPEVWGSDARIVEDYEGRSPIVDGLSRVVVQFKGSNQTEIQAYVVASRDAMKAFLEGGQNRTTYTAAKDPEAQLREIQIKREQAEKRPTRSDDFDGSDDGDRAGYYADVLNRDYSDWGKYSVTGAQISAEEVQGVLLLSDVFGPFTEATKTLAEKIAFECQPVVCMVPDLFRGKPWKEDMTTPGFNEDGQDYEEWRSTHPDVRVSIDIRAAAAVLRERYGVSSIVVWGTCYGGGRALEVAAGYLPDDKVLDVDGSLAPRLVDPDVAVVWYPTRYNAKKLFGAERSPTLTSNDEQKQRNVAVMGVFAGKDKLPGATPDDATELKRLLEEDERIKDCMVKVFTDQDHGFAHNSLGKNEDDSDLDRFVDNEFGGAGRVSIGDGDAEVACLLSTAFMETYSRKFLPTVGVPIMLDDTAEDWNRDVVLRKSSKMRNVREELTKLEQGVMDVKQEGTRIDREDPDDDEILLKALREMDAKDGKYKIGEDDDISTAFEKLVAGDDSFQLF